MTKSVKFNSTFKEFGKKKAWTAMDLERFMILRESKKVQQTVKKYNRVI